MVARFAWKYGIPEARRYGSSKYPQCEFKRATFRDWKTKYEDPFRKENKSDFFI